MSAERMSRTSSQPQSSKAAVWLAAALVTGVTASRIRGVRWMLMAGLGAAVWSAFGARRRRDFRQPETNLGNQFVESHEADALDPADLDVGCDPFRGAARQGRRCGQGIEIEAEDLTGLGAGRNADWLLGSEPTPTAAHAGELVIEGEAAELMLDPPRAEPSENGSLNDALAEEASHKPSAPGVNEGSEIPDEVMIDSPHGQVEGGDAFSAKSNASLLAPWGAGTAAAGAIARDGMGPVPPMVPRHLVPKAPSKATFAPTNSGSSAREGE